MEFVWDLFLHLWVVGPPFAQDHTSLGEEVTELDPEAVCSFYVISS